MTIKPLLTAFALCALLSCNRESSPSGSHDGSHGVEGIADTKTEASGLTLNQGEKWHSDASTQFHADNLNKIAEKFGESIDDEEAHRAFAAEVSNELAELVRDCKMKGPDHDALHLWLEPVMQGAAALEKASTASEGEVTAKRLITDIRTFNHYFENAH